MYDKLFECVQTKNKSIHKINYKISRITNFWAICLTSPWLKNYKVIKMNILKTKYSQHLKSSTIWSLTSYVSSPLNQKNAGFVTFSKYTKYCNSFLFLHVRFMFFLISSIECQIGELHGTRVSAPYQALLSSPRGGSLP